MLNTTEQIELILIGQRIKQITLSSSETSKESVKFL